MLFDNLTSAGSAIAGFAYAYDPAGNRVGVVESAGDRVTWTYDPANQLTSEHRGGVAWLANVWVPCLQLSASMCLSWNAL